MQYKPVLTSQTFRKLEISDADLTNVSVEILSEAPPNPRKGQFYLDLSLTKFMIWDGDNWVIAGNRSEKLEVNNLIGPVIISHSFGRNPNVTIADSNGNMVMASVVYLNETQVKITWSKNFTGIIYLT
jgi:hypothetical protein